MHNYLMNLTWLGMWEKNTTFTNNWEFGDENNKIKLTEDYDNIPE